jgi:hypothetical protein
MDEESKERMVSISVGELQTLLEQHSRMKEEIDILKSGLEKC